MSTSEDRKELQEKEDQLLRVPFLGDIREDAEFLGLTLTDIIWIVINTSLFGFFLAYIMPFSIWFKATWIVIIFVFILFGRIKKWPYRRKRYFRYLRQKRSGDVSSYIELLGAEEDSWIYRNQQNKQVHIVASMTALPWNTSLYKEKQNRIQDYEMFLRSLVFEGFTASVTAETIPDFRHDFWEQKRQKVSVNEGIQILRNNRLDLWEDLANAGDAKRSEYTVTLSIDEKNVATMEQDDEDELSNAERKRNRFMSELRQKKERSFGHLEQSGHAINILSGYSVPEILSRWLHNKAWEEWKVAGGEWEEVQPNQLEEKNESSRRDLAKLHGRVAQMISKENVEEAAVSKEESEHPLEVQQDKSSSEDVEEALQAALGAVGISKGPDRKKPFKAILGWFKGIIDSRKRKEVIDEEIKSTSTDEENEELSTEVESKSRKTFREMLPNLQIKLPTFKQITFKKPQAVVENEPLTNSAANEDTHKHVQEKFVPSGKIQNTVIALTSKGSTGTTFLAANLAVSASLSGYSTVLIDLSPDRGTITVLNPKRDSVSEGWENWRTRHSPDQLEIKLPAQYPTIEELMKCIDDAVTESIVIIDIPWNYPDKSQIDNKYGLVAVLDGDYHHWLQFEIANSDWSGRFWLNQTDDTMTKYMSQLLKDRYSKEFHTITPYYENANKFLYQGRPISLDPELRSIFCEQIMEVTVE